MLLGPLRERFQLPVDVVDGVFALPHNIGDLTASNEWTW